MQATVLRLALSVALLSSAAHCQGGAADSTLAKIPGGQTGAAVLASSADGVSRYLAPDGPIQPGLTAAMGLPMRAGELANGGFTRISSAFNGGAQQLSQAANQGGDVRMPGLAAIQSSLPSSLSSLGQSMQSMISAKNNLIRGQAEAGIQAANRLGQSMRQGLPRGGNVVRASGPAAATAGLLNSAQNLLGQGASRARQQLGQQLSQAESAGQSLLQRASGQASAISSRAQSGAGQLLGGSTSSLAGGLQRNLGALARQAQSAGQQLAGSLQQAAQAPAAMLSSLASAARSG